MPEAAESVSQVWFAGGGPAQRAAIGIGDAHCCAAGFAPPAVAVKLRLNGATLQHGRGLRRLRHRKRHVDRLRRAASLPVAVTVTAPV